MKDIHKRIQVSKHNLAYFFILIEGGHLSFQSSSILPDSMENVKTKCQEPPNVILVLFNAFPTPLMPQVMRDHERASEGYIVFLSSQNSSYYSNMSLFSASSIFVLPSQELQVIYLYQNTETQ